VAIDDIIAAGVHVPQITDPWQVQQRGLALQSLANQGQIQQGQIQGQQIDLANARQAQQDDQTMRQVLSDTGGSLDHALPQLAGKISGDRYMALQGQWLKQQQEKLAIAQGNDKLAEQYHESLGNLAMGVRKAGYTPEAFAAATSNAVNLLPQLSDHLNPYMAQAREDPTTIKPIVDRWIAETDAGRKGLAEERAEAAAGREAAVAPFQQRTAAAAAQSAEQKAAGTEPMTQYQQGEINRQNAMVAEEKRYHDILGKYYQGILDNRAEGGGQTPNSQAVDRRLAMKQLADLTDQENDLHALRLKLGNNIASGAFYVDEKGNMKPMSSLADNEKTAALQDMQNRFNLSTDLVKRVIASKNQIGQTLGMQPSVSTEQAAQAIDRGSRPAAAPGAATPGRPLTDRNLAKQYLDRAGGDRNKARQLARQDGWTF
jgi:hypothetical protein